MSCSDQTAVVTPNIGCVSPTQPRLPILARWPGSTQPVRVACHRGDWRNFPENTLEAVTSCIEMGADIVEVDVWRTSDGHFVVMHDDTLDRTSDGHGSISQHTLEEVRKLRVRDGLGCATAFRVPTLEEVLLLAKDKILVNVDKADLYLDEVFPIIQHAGMVEQTILKSDIPYEKLCEKYGIDIMSRIVFMPIINIKPTTTEADIREYFARHHSLYEVNFEEDDAALLKLVKHLASEDNAVLWINTIWPELCGGHHDDRALSDAEGAWGYAVDSIGAGIMQTDRPALMIKYLKQRGRQN